MLKLDLLVQTMLSLRSKI